MPEDNKSEKKTGMLYSCTALHGLKNKYEKNGRIIEANAIKEAIELIEETMEDI